MKEDNDQQQQKVAEEDDQNYDEEEFENIGQIEEVIRGRQQHKHGKNEYYDDDEYEMDDDDYEEGDDDQDLSNIKATGNKKDIEKSFLAEIKKLTK